MELSTKEQKEYVGIPVGDKRIGFYVPNGPCLYRALTMKTKEPWTLEWIDTFTKGDIFWDIGANVGVYSIYAAVIKQSQVFAFEPEAANFNVLNENIRVNGVADLVKAYCIAISDRHGFDHLNLCKIETAASGHQINNLIRQPSSLAFVQGCVTYTLDQLSEYIPIPTHIKIDVDGVEPLIVNGGLRHVLPKVKSLMIELHDNIPLHVELINRLNDQGLKTVPEVADRSTHKDGPFKGVGEHLFTR